MQHISEASVESDVRADRSARKVEIQQAKLSTMRSNDPARRNAEVLLGVMMRNASMTSFAQSLAHEAERDERAHPPTVS